MLLRGRLLQALLTFLRIKSRVLTVPRFPVVETIVALQTSATHITDNLVDKLTTKALQLVLADTVDLQ